MKSATTVLSKLFLVGAIAGAGALAFYFGVLISATHQIAAACHNSAGGQVTLTITKYNLTPQVRCWH